MVHPGQGLLAAPFRLPKPVGGLWGLTDRLAHELDLDAGHPVKKPPHQEKRPPPGQMQPLVEPNQRQHGPQPRPGVLGPVHPPLDEGKQMRGTRSWRQPQDPCHGRDVVPPFGIAPLYGVDRNPGDLPPWSRPSPVCPGSPKGKPCPLRPTRRWSPPCAAVRCSAASWWF